MAVALVVFVVMYAGMLAFSGKRALFAICAAVLMVILGIVSVREVPAVINWNVIMMILGTMGIVSLFIDSGMPARMADLILSKTPNIIHNFVYERQQLHRL